MQLPYVAISADDLCEVVETRVSEPHARPYSYRAISRKFRVPPPPSPTFSIALGTAMIGFGVYIFCSCVVAIVWCMREGADTLLHYIHFTMLLPNTVLLLVGIGWLGFKGFRHS